MSATVHIFGDRFREPREEPQYEGPSTDELYLRLHNLAKRIRTIIQDDWDDYPWKHRLSDPDCSVPFIEEWLNECAFYTPISEAKQAEDDFEEGEQL